MHLEQILKFVKNPILIKICSNFLHNIKTCICIRKNENSLLDIFDEIWQKTMYYSTWSLVLIFIAECWEKSMKNNCLFYLYLIGIMMPPPIGLPPPPRPGMVPAMPPHLPGPPPPGFPQVPPPGIPPTSVPPSIPPVANVTTPQ